jgi:cobalamin synthase
MPPAALHELYTGAVSTREDWQRRLGPLYGGAVALVHSTPWPWPEEVSDDKRSAGWIVALGVPIGLLAWVIAKLMTSAGLPLQISAIMGLAMLSLASAAIVERGVAERVDEWDGKRAGSPAAVLVLVFTTLIRAFAVVSIAHGNWLLVFLATAVMGRWAAVFLQALGDPIDYDSKRSLAATPAPAWLIGAISLGVAVLVVWALGKAGIVALALAAIGSFVLGLLTQKSHGGLTSSTVAVAAALGELIVLLVATL